MTMMNVKMLAGILAAVLSAGPASGAEPRTLQEAVDMMAIDAGVPARGTNTTLLSIKLIPGQVVAANYFAHFPAHEFDHPRVREMLKRWAWKACADPFVRRHILGRGATFKIMFHDNGGDLIYVEDIPPSRCEITVRQPS
jgi:hypothetical protein